MKEYLSPAKINLGLNIISKREDGYHNIETIFYPIKLYDKIIFSSGSQFKIECNDPTIPTDEKNLIYKARNVLTQYINQEINVNVKLEKNIPSFAGLGGGSSNAAITLIALNEILELNLTEDELIKLASKIGSDVPFFILNKPAFAEGRGEILTPLPNLILDFKIVVVVPDIKISTAWAYSELKKTDRKINLRSIKTTDDFLRSKDYITNDFESIVFPHYPEIQKIKEELINAGAIFSLLSGSGSAVYAIFTLDFDKNEIVKKLSKYRVFYVD